MDRYYYSIMPIQTLNAEQFTTFPCYSSIDIVAQPATPKRPHNAQKKVRFIICITSLAQIIPYRTLLIQLIRGCERISGIIGHIEQLNYPIYKNIPCIKCYPRYIVLSR